MSAMDTSLDEFWRSYFDCENFNENAVAGIHLVELLEKFSPFPRETDNYFTRVNASISFVADEHKAAAVAIFSNVVYLPGNFLDDALRYLWRRFSRLTNIPSESGEIGRNCHFFEVDPSGLLERFNHQNSIHQRLHPDFYARVYDVSALLQVLMNTKNPVEGFVKDSLRQIKKISEKKYWVIISDKVLSGQSLISDLKRYIAFRDIAKRVFGKEPKIYILCQVATDDSLLAIGSFLKEKSVQDVEIIYAFKFGEDMKVNSQSCRIYRDGISQKAVNNFCEWFAERFLAADSRFDTMREKSGDNLAFGYKACGLYFADCNNSPTNSVPPIWYDNTSLPGVISGHIPRYKGPYPRVHSRMGIQHEQPVTAGWSLIDETFVDELATKIRSAD